MAMVARRGERGPISNPSSLMMQIRPLMRMFCDFAFLFSPLSSELATAKQVYSSLILRRYDKISLLKAQQIANLFLDFIAVARRPQTPKPLPQRRDHHPSHPVMKSKPPPRKKIRKTTARVVIIRSLSAKHTTMGATWWCANWVGVTSRPYGCQGTPLQASTWR